MNIFFFGLPYLTKFKLLMTSHLVQTFTKITILGSEVGFIKPIG